MEKGLYSKAQIDGFRRLFAKFDERPENFDEIVNNLFQPPATVDGIAQLAHAKIPWLSYAAYKKARHCGQTIEGLVFEEGGLKIQEGKTPTGNEYVDFKTSKGQHFIAQQGTGNFWFVYHLTRSSTKTIDEFLPEHRDRAVELARARAEAEEAS